ncbi:MAG TPA: RsmE family RNA methyltransferase, partial [Candidatus Baltobacteraceae bacterium]|nr:RsmE family RNA methyltransferase [Candidatus Baltobacteraceae bacterium]
MHRFYLPPKNCAGNSLRLEGREAHHALKVLRVKYGEFVAVLDGVGNEFLCTVENSSRDAVTLLVSLKNFTTPPPCQITLLQALPKGKIIESIIQKSVELGAHRIVPILSERVVSHLDGESAEHKREKWQQVAIEAVKQCGAAWLPEIETPVTIEKFLSCKERFDLSLVGSLQKERRHPREVFQEFEKSHGRPP